MKSTPDIHKKETSSNEIPVKIERQLYIKQLINQLNNSKIRKNQSSDLKIRQIDLQNQHSEKIPIKDSKTSWFFIITCVNDIIT